MDEPEYPEQPLEEVQVREIGDRKYIVADVEPLDVDGTRTVAVGSLLWLVAFLALATEDVAMPPILRLDLPAQNGEVDVKTAYLPRFDSFAIKVSPGFLNNPALGLPSLNGLMLVLSAKTGLTEAVLLD